MVVEAPASITVPSATTQATSPWIGVTRLGNEKRYARCRAYAPEKNGDSAAPAIVVGLSWAARTAFRVFGMQSDREVAVLILLILAAALGAELIHLEGIVGAFLGGIAVKRALGESHAGDSLSIMAHTLFIPVFFLSTGFPVNRNVFVDTLLQHGPLVAAIVRGLLFAKFLAAQIARLLMGASRDERLLMWSLSIPQVAASLAAALVAYTAKDDAGERLLDEPILNTVVVLVLVTSLIGPVLTNSAGRRIVRSAPRAGKPR